MKNDFEYDYKSFGSPKEVITFFNDDDNNDKEIISINYKPGYNLPWLVFYKQKKI